MPRKRHKPEEVVAKLRQVDVMVAQGTTLAEAIRSIGVAEVTYHRWRNEFGGLKLDQVRRLKELEQENARLRRAVSDLTLDKMILSEAMRGTEGPRSETDEPLAPPREGRAGLQDPRRLRAPGVPGPRPAAVDPAAAAQGARRRGPADGRHRRARDDLRPLRLPPDHRAAQAGGVGREQEAGRAHLAARGAQGAEETAEAGPALAGRWVVRAAAAGEAEPRLGLRLRPRSDPRRPQVPDAVRGRRVHPEALAVRVERRLGSAEVLEVLAELMRRARRARAHPLRQRPRVRRHRRQGMGRCHRPPRPPTSSPAAPGRTAPSRASTRSSETSCSTARSSTPCARRRSSSKPGAGTTMR